MTEAETIEVHWLQMEASRIGLHLRPHLNADPGVVAIYVQEMKSFPGRRYQCKPPSLAKYQTIAQAQEFLANYKLAFPGGRNRD